ncbi:MAG: DNA translocase FtsK 4TM domain-containing protein [Candidatus Dojkabacteria bacterium]
MARRKKKKNITIKDPESLAVLGVICLVISALLLVSKVIQSGGDSEVLNAFTRYFGWGVVVMSVVFFLTSLRLFGTKNKYNNSKVVFFLLIFMFCFLGWIHLFAYPDAEEQALAGNLGGIIGYQISFYASKYLALEGALVTLGILMVISFLLALNLSPKQIGEGLVKVIDFITLSVKKIQVACIWMVNALQRGKSSIDNLEMNILSKNSDAEQGIKEKKKNKKGKGDEENDQDSMINLNPFSIKMVSDISGRKEVVDETENEEQVKISMKPSQKKGKAMEKAKDEPVEPLDLSVRAYPDWNLPGLDLLDPVRPKESDSQEVIKRNAKAIQETLKSFNIEAKIAGYRQGPSVTQYFIDPAAGVKFTKISNLSKDLALTLASPSDLRIELIPGTSFIGIDVPNEKRQFTQMRESIDPVFAGNETFQLGMAVGMDTQNKAVVRDLQKAPHLLVAGATGMGKSVLVNAFIISLLMQKSPDELKMIMIDPKMVEMAPYDGIPHLLTSPITDMSKAATALKWAVDEMEKRYKTLKESGVRNIEQYVEETGSLMPYIVVIIDEFSDLMMQFRAEVESSIIRLAQKSRAVGIHLIIATQRPTADVITGLIKSNIPARVALTVASAMDSRVILDASGAETLLGKGDLLFKTANDLKPARIQGLFLDDKGASSEFHRVLHFIKEQAPDVQYNEDEILTVAGEGGSEGDFQSDDPLFRQAAEIVVGAQKGSASLLQTKMKIGYARAARLIDELEMAGVVGPQDGPRPREILVSDVEAFFNQEAEVS